MEYRGQLATRPAPTAAQASPALSGEVGLEVGRDGLDFVGLFAALHLDFSEIDSVRFEDWSLHVTSDAGELTLSRLGKVGEPCYLAVRDAFEAALRRAFFVRSPALVTAHGGLSASSPGAPSTPSANLEVHGWESLVTGGGIDSTAAAWGNAVVGLSPNAAACRIPLAFVTGLDGSGFELRLSLEGGEGYALSRLGRAGAPFEGSIRERLGAIQQQAVDVVREVDPSLSPGEAMLVGRMLVGGKAAPLAKLSAAAPSLRTAAMRSLSHSRIAEYHRTLGELGLTDAFWVGFVVFGADDETPELRANLASEPEVGAVPGLPEEAEGDLKPGREIVPWIIFPSPDREYAAVELPVPRGEPAATYVYRTGGDFDAAAARINRALEALAYHRDVVRLSDEELTHPPEGARSQYADYRLAIRHTPALRWLRANLAGRAIHANPEAWRRSLERIWG